MKDPTGDRRKDARRGKVGRRKEPRTVGWYRWLVKNLKEREK